MGLLRNFAVNKILDYFSTFDPMSGNSFGLIYKLSSFGESHGTAIGGVIDGCPAGISLDIDTIQYELDRRKPGQSHIVTQRKEGDRVEFFSGIFEGKTTGTSIGFAIFNENQKSKDYDHIKSAYRPSHADYTYQEKYGHRDYRGGGRSSARETAARVVAGAIAKQILSQKGIELFAFVESVGNIRSTQDWQTVQPAEIEKNIIRCPEQEVAEQMISLVEQVRKDGDTIGGTIKCVIKGLPVGLGEPVFDKFHAVLGMAMLSINAVKGFEYGSGFEGCSKRGSELNDPFVVNDGKVSTTSNNSGGIQGGITNGMPVYCNIAFKPVATIMQDQQSIGSEGNEVTVSGRGRHDPCVLPRAVPIVEAMAAMVALDFLLRAKANRV